MATRKQADVVEVLVEPELRAALELFRKHNKLSPQEAVAFILNGALRRTTDHGMRAHDLHNGPGVSCGRCGVRGKAALAVIPCV